MSTRFGFVSTYPPTQCGLATFAESLRGALLDSPADECWVVQLVEALERRPAPEVVAQLVADNAGSLRRAIGHLNQCDVVILQHEYGVFGGEDGTEILNLLVQLHVPSVVVLHTVLVNPGSHQRQILETIVDQADAVVTMTPTARTRLADRYSADMAKVSIIGHGAPDLQDKTVTPRIHTGPPTILTWGLLGPGKGIEWGIQAIAMMRDLDPMPRYLIAGQTHPKVALREGEAYRNHLRMQVREAALEPWISFDANYRDAAALAHLIRSSDIVLLPYDSMDQVTSGVLSEAVAARKPVVATQFPHARELLADGVGLTVGHCDPAAIASALRSIILQPNAAAAMVRAASARAPQLLWPAIADEYRALSAGLIAAASVAA